jgi:DNA ligase-1
MISRKLDGIRCIAIFDSDGRDVRFYSREWNEFFTLNKLKKELLLLASKYPEIINFVLDGEICIINENGTENFQQIQWDIKRKDFTIENPLFLIFDMITLKWFLSKYEELSYKDRYDRLLNKFPLNWEHFKVLEHNHILNKFDFEKFLELSRENKWEWLILRLSSAFYEWKRTKKMIKVKDFIDDEYEVMNVTFWKMPMLNEEGIMIERDVLANVLIYHKWYPVDVWSWFNNDEKLYYYNNPNEIIWKTINVRYFEETIDKKWDLSLRFPTFHWIRDYE